MTKKLLYIIILFPVVISAQNKMESAIETSYSNSSWVNSTGYNYEYDGNNNLISTTIYSWNNGSWEESSRNSSTYNGNNKITISLEQQWNGSQYTDTYRSIYNYNSNGDPTQILYQAWNGSQWVDEERNIITYSNNKISQITYDEWNGSQWVVLDRETLTYSNNNLAQAIAEDWNGTEWTNDSREVFTYNANNQLTLNVFETWNGGSWDEGSRVSYDLDANNNLIKEIYSYGNTQQKTEYTYDLNEQLSNFAHPFKDKTGRDYTYENMPHINKVLSETYSVYNTSTESYEPSYRTTYNYNTQLTLGTKDFKTVETISLYPNPADNFIKLKGLKHKQSISIYNALGKKVLEQRIHLKETINTGNLSKGLYFLKLENGTTLKFSKK